MTKTLLLASELTASLPKLADHLSGNGRKLLFIPTAAIGEGWTPEYESHVAPFERMGYEVVTHDLSTSDKPLPEGSATAEFHAVYVCGGNTFFLMRHMRRTGFDVIVTEAIEKGLVYVGSSAGSVAAAPDIGYAASLDDPRLGDGSNAGLGLVDFAILPHLHHPSMGEAVAAALSDWNNPLRVFAMADHQVFLVEDMRTRIL
jgi:dipeptidase E